MKSIEWPEVKALYMQAEERKVDVGSPRILFLDGFRGYAIVMVVATHAMAYASLDTSMVSFFSFWVQAVAVPPFFLVDGFLFERRLSKKQKFSYEEYLVRSAKRLLLPWILFSSLYVAFRAGFEYVGHSPVTFVLGHTPGEILTAVYYSSISAQLYFLPALFFIRALAFATRYLTLFPSVSLIVFWMAYVGVWQALPIGYGTSDRIDPLINAVWGMQYYLLGMVLAIHEEELRRSPFLFAAVSLTCLFVVKIGIPSWVVFAQYAYLFSLFFLFLGLSDEGYPFTWLGRFTMGIYLIHAPIILKFVSYILKKVFDQSGVVLYLLISIGVLFISVVIVSLLAKTAWWKYLVGEETRETPVRSAMS